MPPSPPSKKPTARRDQTGEGQRQIDVLESLRIVEALKGNPRRVFADILRLSRLEIQICYVLVVH